MTVRTEAHVVVGDAVTLQLPQIGIVEALVCEVVFGGFDLSFEPAPKSKLGTYVICSRAPTSGTTTASTTAASTSVSSRSSG